MTFQIADKRNPFMGLDNKICKDPVYWCRLHQVWLSDEDVKKKQCNCKKTFDMVGTYRCGNLVKRGNRMKLSSAKREVYIKHTNRKGEILCVILKVELF